MLDKIDPNKIPLAKKIDKISYDEMLELSSLGAKVMQPTFRPHRKKRARKIGYRARMATPGGRKVIRARRLKGRKRLTVV